MINKKKKSDYFWPVLLCLVAVHFLFMVKLSGHRSLWYDDIFQIDFVGNGQSFKDVTLNLLRTDLNPPLWGLLSMIWIRIAPYGTAWIRMISEIFVSLGIVFLACAGRKVWSSRTGIIAAGLCVISSMLITQAAYALRCYGCLFLFSSLFIYSYVIREEEKNLVNTLFMSMSMILFASTHYFGVFAAVIIAGIDLVRLIAKWIRDRKMSFGEICLTFLPYFLSLVVMLPWVLAQLTTITATMENFWPQVPDYDNVNDIFMFLASNEKSLFALFLIGAFMCLSDILTGKKKKFPIACFIVPGVLVIGIFVYSVFLSGSSVWVSRYFISVVAFFILGVAWTMERLYQIVSNAIKTFDKQAMFRGVLPSILMGLLVYNMFVNVDAIVPYARTVYEPFMEVAEGLMQQPDILEPDTLVYVTTPNGDGWRYYLSHNGEIDISQMNLVDNTTMKYYESIDFSQFETIYYFKVHWKEKVTMDYDAMESKLNMTHSGYRMELPGEVYCYTRVS